MCLAIPGLIVAIAEGRPPRAAAAADSDADALSGRADPGASASEASDADLWRLAQVDFGGVRQTVSLACLPEARVGDRVLVHVGLAISLVEEEP